MAMNNMIVDNAKVMAKGQITLPKDIREVLGVGMGDRVTLICRDNQVIMMNAAVYAMILGVAPSTLFAALLDLEENDDSVITPDGLSQYVSDADAVIISVALGLINGSPIPVENSVLRNNDGSIVMTSMNPESLRTAAERSGGISIDGNQHDALARLKNQIVPLSQEHLSRGFRREPKTWHHLFIILALIAYGFSKLFELDIQRARGKYQ